MQFDTLPDADHPLVALRPIRASDIGDWLAILRQPAVYGPTSWNGPALAARDLAHHVWRGGERLPADALRLAIVVREADRLVGTIAFHTVTPAERSAELAYELSPVLWGRGIATHLGGRMVAWAHARAGIRRVQATVLVGNERSARVLERIGFAREGLLRGHRMVRGVPGDFHLYAHTGGEGVDPGA